MIIILGVILLVILACVFHNKQMERSGEICVRITDVENKLTLIINQVKDNQKSLWARQHVEDNRFSSLLDILTHVDTTLLTIESKVKPALKKPKKKVSSKKVSS